MDINEKEFLIIIRQKKIMDVVSLSHFGECSKISTILSFNKILSLLIKTSKYSVHETVYLGIKNVPAFSLMFVHY